MVINTITVLRVLISHEMYVKNDICVKGPIKTHFHVLTDYKSGLGSILIL